MSLFEKVKNIRRNNLQEKRKFPGDESGAYKRVKADIDAKRGLRDAGASGDFSPTMPTDKRKKEQAKRDARIKKLDTPDPFDIDTSKAAKQTAKDFGTPTKSQIKKLDKKPGGYRAPKGDFGPGITQGQANVKGMDAKAIFKTEPKDVKLPQSFTDFERNLQDYKDRDLPGGPRKTTTKPKTSGTSLTRQDVGMAPPDKPKTVKQSEVSKKAQDFTQKVDVEKKIKDAIVKKRSTKSKSDVNRIAQNKIDIEKANQFKKTDAYQNIVQGKDSQGNYLTPQQRKKKFKEFQSNLKNAKQNVDKKVTQGAAPDYVAKSGSKSKGATFKSKGFKSTATAGGNKVTMNTTRGAKSGPRSVSKPPTSRFRKIVDKIRTSKIGSKVIKGLSKSRYGKIAGVALGVAGTAAGISALNRPKSGKGTKLDFSKDIVRGPSIRNLVKNDKGNLVAGKPKRFQLGQKVTMDDLKNTTFTRKLTDQQLAKAKTNNKNT